MYNWKLKNECWSHTYEMWSPFIQQYLQYHARLQYHQNRPFLWLYRFCRLRWRIYWKYISHCSRLLYPTNILVIFSLWINESIYNIIHIQVSAFSGCLLFVGKIEEEEEAYTSRKKTKFIHPTNRRASFITMMMMMVILDIWSSKTTTPDSPAASNHQPKPNTTETKKRGWMKIKQA